MLYPFFLKSANSWAHFSARSGASGGFLNPLVPEFQSSRVPEFLNSLVLGFLKYGIISCYLNFARENEIRGTYRAHAKSSSSLELNFGSSVLGFLPSQIL